MPRIKRPIIIKLPQPSPSLTEYQIPSKQSSTQANVITKASTQSGKPLNLDTSDSIPADNNAQINKVMTYQSTKTPDGEEKPINIPSIPMTVNMCFWLFSVVRWFGNCAPVSAGECYYGYYSCLSLPLLRAAFVVVPYFMVL